LTCKFFEDRQGGMKRLKLHDLFSGSVKSCEMDSCGKRAQ
jgi:hypothetical protein